jgi:Phytanoyl-CoA dioxygenase (PhyH)
MSHNQAPVFDLTKLDSAMLDELARHYEDEGYSILGGLQELVTQRYLPVLARTAGLGQGELEAMLDPRSAERMLPEDLRKRFSRVSTPQPLAGDLVRSLSPVLARLLGPIVHVSRDFHAQFKCGVTGRVGYGGYDAQASFLEVHGAYQLHQDFTGASIPTSPAALILWVGLNDCPDWPIRFYPRSHKLGLVCRRFVPVDHERLPEIGQPMEFHARPGTGIVFNSLLLHGTGDGGGLRRVSCDIRFFPSCPWLGSEPRALVGSPMAFVEDRLDRETASTLRAPLLENLALTGQMGDNVEAPPHSILNWANYLNEVLNGDPMRGPVHIERFANAEIGMEPPAAYVEQFHGRPMQAVTLERIREALGAPQPAEIGNL